MEGTWGTLTIVDMYPSSQLTHFRLTIPEVGIIYSIHLPTASELKVED